MLPPAAPSSTDQVTPPTAVPVTCAVKESDPPVAQLVEAGVTLTVMPCWAGMLESPDPDPHPDAKAAATASARPKDDAR
jgi:hypothetical protein